MLKLFKKLVFLFILLPTTLLAKEVERVNTTNPEITISNLNSQINTLEALLAKDPSRAIFRSSLFDLISTRAQFLGSYSDFDILKKLSDQLPSDEQGLLVKARYHNTMHEFSKALAILDSLSNKNLEVRSFKIRIKLALRQDLEKIKAEQLEILNQYKKHSDFLLIAEIESELGNFEQADKYFEDSFKSYADSSPLPLAYLFFRRGVMWSEKADNQELGLQYYNEAVHYLPQFVNAQVHRNEIIAKENISEAITSLMSVATSEDPEPRGLLGELYLKTGQEMEAKKIIKSASDSYTELLNKYPLAFADHASEFYSGPGNNDKLSLELAYKNLENRKTERSYIVALESALKANNTQELCKLINESKNITPVYVSLIKIIKENDEKCLNANILKS